MISLAVKYRPQTFDEVAEQSATKVCLQQQLDSREIKNGYLFCGPAGCGKTTCARIFAKEINNDKGAPIELDAASNNSVDDVRDIIQQAKTTSLNSEYKIFIMDEVHALSNSAWQAMLKVLEEPPAKSVFILCTTDPQKIPRTILSRVQRYDFQRMSEKSIIDRLKFILKSENENDNHSQFDEDALRFIARQAQGGMRDAITMLDKCLAYTTDLTVENVISALGMASYKVMSDLLTAIAEKDRKAQVFIINEIYKTGYDLKMFIKSFTKFVLDYSKWSLGADSYLECTLTKDIEGAFNDYYKKCNDDVCGELLLGSLIKLQTDIKWDTNPKSRIEAWCITGE